MHQVEAQPEKPPPTTRSEHANTKKSDAPRPPAPKPPPPPPPKPPKR